MNRDLDDALRDLAAGAAAAHRDRASQHPGLVLAPTVGRVRRRRRARAAAAATGSLAVVAGLVLGGFALAPDTDPEPQPAGPSPSPSASTPGPAPTATSVPSPEPPAVVLPAGDPSLPFGACGALATAAPEHAVDAAFETSISVRESSVPAGGSAAVSGWVARSTGDDFGFSAVPASGPRTALVRDGVVVATGQLGGDPSWVLRGGFQGEAGWTADWLPLAVCAPEGQPAVTAGAPLPAGEYELIPWADVVNLGDYPGTPSDGTGEQLELDELIAVYGTQATVVGEPVGLTITGEAEGVAPAPGTGAEAVLPTSNAAPVCGEPAPVADQYGPLQLEWRNAGGTITADGTVAATDLDVRYVAGDRLGFSLAAAFIIVSQDGRVVGQSPFWGEGEWQVSLASGTAFPMAAVTENVTTCEWQPLPSGNYDVVVSVGVLPDARAGTGTGDGWTTLFSDPATYVVP